MTNFNNTLMRLYQHEVELCCLYQEWVEHIKTPQVRETIQNFFKKHSHHVASLSKSFNWPENPWGKCKTNKSYLLSYKALNNIRCEEDALKAIQTGELLTIKAYQHASRQNIEDDTILNIFNQHIIDNQKPYEYTNTQLKVGRKH